MFQPQGTQSGLLSIAPLSDLTLERQNAVRKLAKAGWLRSHWPHIHVACSEFHFQFASHNLDVSRCFNTDRNPIPMHFGNNQSDVLTDNDSLTFFSTQN
jgi:hypothetical protein